MKCSSSSLLIFFIKNISYLELQNILICIYPFKIIINTNLLTVPNFSEAFAFQILIFISSDALKTNLLSNDQITLVKCCIRLV